MSEALPMRVPGDKSISHRALIFASFAAGESRLRNVLPSDDVQSTARVLRQLGCAVPALPADGGEIRLPGSGLRGWQPPADALDCGNSGTTARLMLGALAGGRGAATLTGDASLRSRPMRRVTAPLAHAGARFAELADPDRLPIRVDGGALRPVHHESPIASAQVKSALLLAALRSGVPANIVEPRLSRDHTERMLSAMGVAIRTEAAGDGRVRILSEPLASDPDPLDLAVPGDFSSAAFLLALGLAGERPIRVEGVCLNPTRTGLLAVLQRMGGRLDVEESVAGGEPVGSVTAWPSALRGTTVTGDEVPALIDEVPVLAILAARAAGTTVIEGAGELRVKESDRLAALAANLAGLGVDVEETPDGLIVRGSDRPVRGGARALHDHRIAMAFGVLGALPGCDVRVDDPDVASVSFPDFWTLLERARRA